VTNGLDDAGDSVELRNRGLEEADLTSFLNDCRDVPKDAKKAKALWLTDLLDVVRQFVDQVSWNNLQYPQALDDGDLHKRKRKKCLRYLRKLCGTFGILPSSFILELAFDERGTEPFATGGFSYVYKATINGRPVAVKTLRVPTTADPKKVHKVSGLDPKISSDRSRRSLSSSSKKSSGGSGLHTITSCHSSVSRWRLRSYQSYRNGWRMGTSSSLSKPTRSTIASVS